MSCDQEKHCMWQKIEPFGLNKACRILEVLFQFILSECLTLFQLGCVTWYTVKVIKVIPVDSSDPNKHVHMPIYSQIIIQPTYVVFFYLIRFENFPKTFIFIYKRWSKIRPTCLFRPTLLFGPLEYIHLVQLFSGRLLPW